MYSEAPRQWEINGEMGVRLDLDESNQMIIEHMAGPKMINTILCTHLLFINSVSAIKACAQMKGEGRRVQFGHH